MNPWKTIARTSLGQPNRYCTVEMRTVELPDGRQIADWAWLELPDFATVLARDDAGRFLCFRQFKYAVGDITLALPGGFLETGEDPEAGARRELLEETGYAAARWLSLGQFIIDANRGAGRGHLFLALEARPQQMPQADDLEEQELVKLTADELERAVDQGQFKVMPWAAAVALGLRRLEKEMKS